MAKHANTVTGYNASSSVIPAFSPVSIGAQMFTTGISDDICMEVTQQNLGSAKTVGITTCELAPGFAGTIVVSGIANAVLAGFFAPGDTISANDNGSWNVDDKGSVRVISQAGKGGIGTVLIGTSSNAQESYNGMFTLSDLSKDGSLKLAVSGGKTDLGEVLSRDFDISGSVEVHLLAEYVRNDDNSGVYRQMITTDFQSERSSDEYALWLLGSVSVYTRRDGTKYLKLTQEHRNGMIHWGSRFWI